MTADAVAASHPSEVAVSHQLLAYAPSDLPIPAADPALVEALVQPRLSLFWGAETTARTLLAVATALAGRGQPVCIFDGGNRFDGYYVAPLELRPPFYEGSAPRAASERLLPVPLAPLNRLAAAGRVIVGAREPQTLVK